MRDVLKKNTILMKSGPAHDPDKKHLFVVCNDKCQGGYHLMVPICSYIDDKKSDSTCILNEHEHAFLDAKSCIEYRFALIEKSESILLGIKTGALTKREDVNGQTFLKIAKGVCRSKNTPRKVRYYAGCEDRPNPSAQ